MKTIKGLKNWILPYYHNEVLNYDTRICVFYGGAGSGKSVFVVQKLILKALNSKRKILVCRKVGATIRDSIFAEFKDKLYPFSMFINSINKTDLTITFVNGSEIIFKGLDDSEKIKSIQGIDDVVIEEATEITQDDFSQLSLRLRSNKPHNQIHLMFNPVSKANWAYRYFFETKPPANCKIIHSTFKDNPKLPQDYIAELQRLKLTNPNYYKIYVLGEFATLDKLIFQNVKIQLIPREEVEKLPFWVGLDFGYINDPSAITWGRYDSVNSIIYICGEYTKTGMTNDKIAKVIKALGFAKERIIADSAEEKSIEEIRRLGIPRIKGAIKGVGSVKLGIDKLLRNTIIIDESCINTIE